MSMDNLSPIQRLPEELYDEILSHLSEPYTATTPGWLNNDDWPARQPPEDAVAYDYSIRIFRDQERHPGDLQDVRLTCKAFHRAATRALFSRSCVLLQPVQVNSAQALEQLSTHRGSLSGLAPAVKRVRIDLGLEYGSFFGDVKIPDEKKAAFVRFMLVLPRAAEKFALLETLILNLEGCETDWRDQSEEIERERAPHFDWDLVDSLRNGLVVLFKTVSFEHLTDLRLSMTCAYDFGALRAALPNRTCSQLKSLHLGYVDATGAGGSTRYLLYTDDDGDGDDSVQFSNLQNQYPNSEYMEDMCAIVGRCPNLESLGLSGTQHLDCDLLNWHPTPGKGLKTLYMDRTKLSLATLIRLLSAPSFTEDVCSKASESPMFSLWLDAVELKDGTWADVLKHLLQCPAFSYFNPKDLNYVRDGASHHHKTWNFRAWEESTNIFTTNEEDEDLLSVLINKLVDKAGGLDSYPQTQYETLNM